MADAIAIVAISIDRIVTGSTAAIAASCFRLQRHRGDVVAMTASRTLAGQAAASQKQVGTQIARPAVGARGPATRPLTTLPGVPGAD